MENWRIIKGKENIDKAIVKLANNAAFDIHGKEIAKVINQFIRDTKPLNWQGLEPKKATKRDGKQILEEYMRNALKAT
ncbi:MAG: hypothetical protein KAX30_04515 [Candidatus Atribacteria bacterium]|nr:hypothetical protein [Candidatus Atribacteria bacterium]